MGKTKKWKENHETKVTKIPKTKRRNYGMNEALVLKIPPTLRYKTQTLTQNLMKAKKNDKEKKNTMKILLEQE